MGASSLFPGGDTHTQGHYYSDLYYYSFASRTSRKTEEYNPYSFELALFTPRDVGAIHPRPGLYFFRFCRLLRYDSHIIKFTCFKFTIQ